MAKNRSIMVEGREISVILEKEQEYISLTDMLKAKDGDFFISDWLRNRNTVEYLGIWESVYNPNFNWGEFAIIKGQAGLIRPALLQNKLDKHCLDQYSPVDYKFHPADNAR
jgi:hypothetical protein